MKPAFAIALLLSLAACAGADSRCAALSPGRYCLQPSAGMAPFEATQMINLRYGERRESLVAEIEVDAGGLRMVGLTPFGQKLLQVNYDNSEVHATTVPGARFDPVFLAATLQWAHWPAQAVRAGLSEPLRLEEGAGERRIVSGAKTLVSIRLEGERPPYRSVWMALHEADLEMTAQTLDGAAVPR